MDKGLKRYLVRLRRALVCPKADRERLFSRGKTMAEEFCAEDPRAGYEELVRAFGEPKDFAAEMLAQLDPAEVERAGKRRRYIRRGLAAAVLLVLISCSIYWAVKWTKAQEIIHGDFKVVETVEPYTEEELNNRLEKLGIEP